MAIPDISRESIEQALIKFDDLLRNSPEWKGWEDRKSQKFAIDAKGRRYPPKQIVSMATGLPVSGFYGGEETNRYLRRREFRVIALREREIADVLEKILADYKSASIGEKWGKEASMYKLFERAEELLGGEEIIGEYQTLKVVASSGAGNWARVPWISFLDSRETDSTQRGIYVVILFRQDGSGLYVTFNQGVTEPKKTLGNSNGIAAVRRRASEIRNMECCESLEAAGFLLDDTIDLHADPGLGKDYEASTIAHKFYARGSVPDDAQLLSDLTHLFRAYNAFLSGAWIFQGSPQIFDVHGAVQKLKQIRWLATQHASDMKKGDRVYVWESGRDAGIVAIGQILETVRNLEGDPESAPFNREKEPDEGPRPRVLISIDKVVEPRLLRTTIKDDPQLTKLSILGMPRGTNFTVTNEERRALDALLGREKGDPIDRALCLIGTWTNVEASIEKVSSGITANGAWASPWSFPIRQQAEALLRKPFYLFINAGGGRIPVRLRIADYVTSTGNAGQQSPWPEITDKGWIGKTREGNEPSDVFKTWLRVDEITKLSPELNISEFEPAEGLSVAASLLHAMTFGYAYQRGPGRRVDSAGQMDSGDRMDALVARTLLTREFLEEVIAAISAPIDNGGSPQIVFAGPPGTSKTWIAQAIAQYVAGSEEKIRFVQFHPNYSYEGFVEGLRPKAEGGGIRFENQPGALLSLVRDMRDAHEVGPSAPLYVLIVDEMNRANLPRVFGELMYLFEYRDKSIRLQYSEEFALPANVRFIGTMNTADRSIRSIDIALRRRFDVFELTPEVEVLRRYFEVEGHTLKVPNLYEGFSKLNMQLEKSLDRHHTIGHAFFMKPTLDRRALRAIWDRKIYPLIEEYFFDQLDIAKKDYVLEVFWPE